MTRHWNWGRAIALVYTSFALSTAAFVAFAMQQRVDLVSADYYARSLEVDARRAARARAETLAGFTIAVSGDGHEITVTWPPEQRGQVRGTMALYRPSNSASDRAVPIAPDASNRQTFSLAGEQAGRWIMQLSWEANEQAHYVERAVSVR